MLYDIRCYILLVLGILSRLHVAGCTNQICDSNEASANVETTDNFWQYPPDQNTYQCAWCSKNASQTPPFCLCDPGSFLVDNVCTACPSDHFCRGAYEFPSKCPMNSKDGRVSPSTVMDDCVCNAGYFRSDNTEAITLALAQNIILLEHAMTLWCVSCPIGFVCSTTPILGNYSQAVAKIEKCHDMSTTSQAGSSSTSQCICKAGSYAHSSIQNVSTMNTTRCTACDKNYYCHGQSFAKRACPKNTFSIAKATSIDSCICLPPFMVLPAMGVDFSNNCVLQNMVAYTDTSIVQTMQQNQYDIFGVEATVLHDTYAELPATQCLSIETGAFHVECECGFRLVAWYRIDIQNTRSFRQQNATLYCHMAIYFVHTLTWFMGFVYAPIGVVWHEFIKTDKFVLHCRINQNVYP